MQVQALFFDAAGTLFHLAEPVGHTYARFAAAVGLSIAPAEVEAAFRLAWKALPPPLHPENRPPADDDRSWWRQLVARSIEQAAGHPIPPAILDPLFESLYSHFAQSEAWTLHEDTKPTLRILHERYPLFVVSNFDRRLHSILQGLGIAGFFTRVILSSEVGASKPHHRIFDAALAACGLPAASCLHIGDDPRCDDEGARAAGLSSFLLNRPNVGLRQLLESLK